VRQAEVPQRKFFLGVKMILTGYKIEWAIEHGYIDIDPFNVKQLNPNSYNVRLSPELVCYCPGELDMKKKMKTFSIKMDEKGFLLKPGILYLGATVETIGSDQFVPIIDGRSSVGRLGINVHATAGYGDLGFKGTFTLELSVVQPVMVYPNVQIAQVRFQAVHGYPSTKYKGKYNGQTLPRASKLWREFKGGIPK
jgi:dCTP deaminase